MGVDTAMVPSVILKAVAWVESNWHQFSPPADVPLLSYDFGYGTMQITSGMAGAFGDPIGSLPLPVQDRIGGNYLYNIAYGAKILGNDFLSMPPIDDRDPTNLEDWYYAVWAYNGWGWVNNPNNPYFSRKGTPATNPSSFPYQERVFYWIQHPPLGPSGHPLWTPMRVNLPTAKQVGHNPGPLSLSNVHQEIPHPYAATYDVPGGPTRMTIHSTVDLHVRVYNSGGVRWTSNRGKPSFALIYHWVRPAKRSNPLFDPHLGGIDVTPLNIQPTFLKRTVAVAGAVRLSAQVRAPGKTGKLYLEWDMASRTHGLFTSLGVPPGYQNVKILSGKSVPRYHQPSPAAFLRGNHGWFVRLTSDPVPSVLTEGEGYQETVLLFNPGGTTWGSNYDLGTAGGARSALPVSKVAPCRTVPWTLQGTAPATTGSYERKWRLITPTGQFFGPILDVKFRVVKAKASTMVSSRHINILL